MASTFDSADIDYLVDHFDIIQLRIEIKNALNRLKGEYEWKSKLYYEDYIKACRIAIELHESTMTPVSNNLISNNHFESADTIKSRYDLVEYISQYVKLRKSGDKFQGLCPFHADKNSASFFVYPNNTFHCFGCQAHGTIIDFVMKHDGLDFKSAIAKLR